MDFGDIENRSIASIPFSATFTSENRSCQDTQLRHRKSPRKRLRAIRTLALVIEQLRCSFQHAGDFAPRMRARRNWRPEFLIRCLSDNRRGDNEECAAVQRAAESCCRSFVPDTPRIYSIGLHSCVKNVSVGNDLLNAFNAIRSFKRRLRRSVIVCKHWVAQSTASLSSAVSLKERANRQTTKMIDYPKSAEVFKVDRFRESNRHDDQCREESEKIIGEKDGGGIVPSTSSNDYAFGDRSFTPDYLDHSVVRKCCKHDRLRVTKKDAQVQTSSKKKTSRRKQQTMKKSRATNEGIVCREYDEPTFKSSNADFRSDIRGSDRTSRNGDPRRLSIRFLENKRAEYINKFTTVKQQIEEITATLRETCCSEKNSRGNAENCEKRRLPLTRDGTNVNSKYKFNTNLDEVNDKEDHSVIPTKKKNVLEEDEIIRKSVGNRKNVERILDIVDVDYETSVFSDKEYLKNAIDSTTNLREGSSANDIFARDCMLTMQEMLRPSNETPRICHRKRAKCRFGKQISFQSQDLTKDDGESRKFAVEDQSCREVYKRNNFVVANDDGNAKVLVQDFANLDEPRCRRMMIVDEKMGEIAVLNDIKKRIDKDFDDPSSKSENDTEDLTVSRENVNFENDSQLHRSITTANTTMIVESSPSLNSTDQNRNSVWTETTEELSNKNSTFSVYHSCTQFPSFVSLRENEDELALAAEDHSVIDDSSYLNNSHLNADRYDSNVLSNVAYSRVSSNDRSQSNLNFDRPLDNVRSVAQDTSRSEYTSPNKFLFEAIDEVDESNNACDMFGSREMSSKVYYCEYPLDGSNEKEKESCVHLEQQYSADTTFETSKSSRYIGSIDSGVFVNSSLIDLQAHENSFDGDESDYKRKQRRVKDRELHGSSRAFEFTSDSNSSSSSCCTDDTLDRRINDVIKDLTKNLVLCERRVRMKLREMRKAGSRTTDTRYSPHSPPRACKFNDSFYDAFYNFFKSPRRSCEDERISGVSTPSFMSLPGSDNEDYEPICNI